VASVLLATERRVSHPRPPPPSRRRVQVGAEFSKNEAFAAVESVKVSFYLPVCLPAAATSFLCSRKGSSTRCRALEPFSSLSHLPNSFCTPAHS
jgi:hypothetical protein